MSICTWNTPFTWKINNADHNPPPPRPTLLSSCRNLLWLVHNPPQTRHTWTETTTLESTWLTGGFDETCSVRALFPTPPLPTMITLCNEGEEPPFFAMLTMFWCDQCLSGIWWVKVEKLFILCLRVVLTDWEYHCTAPNTVQDSDTATNYRITLYWHTQTHCIVVTRYNIIIRQYKLNQCEACTTHTIITHPNNVLNMKQHTLNMFPRNMRDHLQCINNMITPCILYVNCWNRFDEFLINWILSSFLNCCWLIHL